MVKTQSEDLELLKIKKDNEVELLRIKEELAEKEHKRKMERLTLIFETAKVTGTNTIQDDDKNLLGDGEWNNIKTYHQMNKHYLTR